MKCGTHSPTILRDLSHKLRTPLTGVLGMTEILSQETLTQTQREYVEDIRQSGAQLLSAINDLFEETKTHTPIAKDAKTKSNNKEIKKRILLVEDVLIVQKVHRMMLEKLDCRIDIASSGQQALALFRTNQYDAILLDIGLPDISGIDVATQVRDSKKANANIPIIALTADATDEIQNECLTVGINVVATKPINIQHLNQLLQRWV